MKCGGCANTLKRILSKKQGMHMQLLSYIIKNWKKNVRL